jgi:general secretion pathway protein G
MKSRRNNRRRARGQVREQGFTLLELIVVVTIIGILATIALPALKNVPTRAAESVLMTDLVTFRNVIDQYYADKGNYPPTLEALVEEGYLRAIPRDPITKSSDTWVVVYEEFDSEEQPADTDLPEDGSPGIQDVHSGAEHTSLDGTPYSEW